jgi:hypothetical protein
MMPAPPGYVSVKEAQEILGLSRQRAYQLVDLGRLASRKTADGRLWVSMESIAARQANVQALGSNNCITSQEVADFFGVDDKTVRTWHTSGLLRARKFNNRLCFSTNDIIKFVPPSSGHAGRNPARAPTRTLRGRYYPEPTRPGKKQQRGKDI